MREKPVKSPMVPPTADSWSSNFAARSWQLSNNVAVRSKKNKIDFSFVIREKVVVSKWSRTNWRELLNLKSNLNKNYWSVFLILFSVTAQSITKVYFVALCALVVSILLDQIIISLLIRLQSRDPDITLQHWRSDIRTKITVKTQRTEVWTL